MEDTFPKEPEFSPPTSSDCENNPSKPSTKNVLTPALVNLLYLLISYPTLNESFGHIAFTPIISAITVIVVIIPAWNNAFASYT